MKKCSVLCCIFLIIGILPAGVSFQDTLTDIPKFINVRTASAEIWEQEYKLLALDNTTANNFGESVCIDGDTAIIGIPLDDDNGPGSGSAYIFTRSGTTWSFEQKLLPSDGSSGKRFGQSVSIDGDTALIGAYHDYAGSVYVYTRTGTTWTQQAKLLASDGEVNEYFGVSVSLDGDTALIGAFWDDDNGDYSGSAYVFVRTDTTWSQQAKLLASDGVEDDQFGVSVSLFGDSALIGSFANDAGSAYVFTRSGTTWTQQAKLLASDGGMRDEFGISVSLNGDSALIGAWLDSDNGHWSGSAYVFTRSGTTWTQQAKLLASDGETDDNFGVSVSLDGDRALVGSYWNNDYGVHSGSAYIFTRTGTMWTEQTKLLASDGVPGALFGKAVSIQADTALISVTYDAEKGCAYVFKKSDNQPPNADFSWMPQNPANNESITFNASSSYDPDGTITKYEWDWDNNGVYDEAHSSPTATHSWTRKGSYPVALRVTDDGNAQGTIIKTVNVSSINIIIDINGGLGVKAVITNNGTTPLSTITWQLQVTGGIFGKINKTINGTVDIPSGKSVTVKTGMLLGFGAISIIAKVAGEEQTATGFQFIILSMVKK